MTPRLRSTSAILVAFTVPLGVYVASLRGNVSYWDTGDLQTVPYILGIAYPTGFPGYTLLGWAWSHAVAVGNVAWRMNLLSAVATAASCAWLLRAAKAAGAGEAAALAGALIFASTGVVWSRATYADAHPLGFAFVLAAFVCALRWGRDGDRREAVATIVLSGAALAVDNTTILELAGVALLLTARRLAWRPARAAGLAAAALVAASYAYLPVRSAILTAQQRDPTLALGIAAGRPFWDDHHPSSFGGFVQLVSGSDFGPHTALAHMFGPHAVRRVIVDFYPQLLAGCGPLLLWLALFGAVVMWWRAPRILMAAALFGLVPILFIFAYPAEADVARYYPPAFAAVIFAAVYGVHVLGSTWRPPVSIAAGITGALALFAVLAQNAQANVQLFEQRNDRGAAAFVERVVAQTPPRAIIIAPWLYATPLAYGAYVSGALGDRIVVTANPSDHLAEYRRWRADRAVVIVSDSPAALLGIETTQLDRDASPGLYAVK